jgi:lysyl-tRNA synthetase class 2
MVEWYEAYSDASKQRAFIEKLFRFLVKSIHGKTSFLNNGTEIETKKSFNVISYYDLLRRFAMIEDPEKSTRENLGLSATRLGIKVEPEDGREKILDLIYKKTCRPKLIQPTFIIDYPANMFPLAKRNEKNKEIIDAFQLVIGGMEIVKAFSELNDPEDQAERFIEQERQRASGDREAQQTDKSFLEALEHGMPPAGGVGIGIDRLVMLLTDTRNIREAILFPTLRPKKD